MTKNKQPDKVVRESVKYVAGEIQRRLQAVFPFGPPGGESTFSAALLDYACDVASSSQRLDFEDARAFKTIALTRIAQEMRNRLTPDRHADSGVFGLLREFEDIRKITAAAVQHAFPVGCEVRVSGTKATVSSHYYHHPDLVTIQYESGNLRDMPVCLLERVSTGKASGTQPEG